MHLTDFASDRRIYFSMFPELTVTDLSVFETSVFVNSTQQKNLPKISKQRLNMDFLFICVLFTEVFKRLLLLALFTFELNNPVKKVMKSMLIFHINLTRSYLINEIAEPYNERHWI